MNPLNPSEQNLFPPWFFYPYHFSPEFPPVVRINLVQTTAGGVRGGKASPWISGPVSGTWIRARGADPFPKLPLSLSKPNQTKQKGEKNTSKNKPRKHNPIAQNVEMENKSILWRLGLKHTRAGTGYGGQKCVRLDKSVIDPLGGCVSNRWLGTRDKARSPVIRLLPKCRKEMTHGFNVTG